MSISAVNDYIKDKNFVKLASDVKKDHIGVIRGKQGVTQTVSIYKLVVGDIVLLEPGCMVPADCVLVEGEDMIIDESKYSDDRYKERKRVVTEDNFSQFPDPFLLSNTFITQGNGKAVVCVVGDQSRRGSHDEKLDTDSKTPLQQRLERLGAQATKVGIQASGLILVASLLNFTMKIIFDGVMPFDQMLNTFANFVTQFITVIIVAVPEGLPLTISLSLAYSVVRMKKDGILIKDLNSPEVMGCVSEILIGKTGTLTYGDLKVTDFYVQSKHIVNKRMNTLFNTDLDPNVLTIIQNSILFNTEARIEMNDKAFFEPRGNNTEVALLKFLQDAELPI